MATRARYILLDMLRRTGPVDGYRFYTGTRTGWTFRLNLGYVESDVTVVLEGSPTGASETEFETRHTVVLSATGVTKLENSALDTPYVATDRVMRATITASGGDYALEIAAAAPWFDPTDDSPDLLLLPTHIRRFDETGLGAGRIRIVEEAEHDVLTFLRQDRSGQVWLDMENDMTPILMKQAIALQAEHVFQKDRLRASREGGSALALNRMSKFAAGLEPTLAPVMPTGTLPVWRGR